MINNIFYVNKNLKLKHATYLLPRLISGDIDVSDFRYKIFYMITLIKLILSLLIPKAFIY